MFSVEVSALASGLLGEGPAARVRGVGPVPVVVAGSVPAPTQPAEPGVSDIGPGDSPRGRRPAVVSAQIHSEPDGSPVPILTCAPVSLSRAALHREPRHCGARCPAPRTQENRVTTPVDSSAVVELLGGARLRRADRLRPARRGRPAGPDPGRPRGAGPHGGRRDRPPRPAHRPADRARRRPGAGHGPVRPRARRLPRGHPAQHLARGAGQGLRRRRAGVGLLPGDRRLPARPGPGAGARRARRHRARRLRRPRGARGDQGRPARARAGSRCGDGVSSARR